MLREAAIEAMEKDLTGMRMADLRRRAIDEGVPQETVEDIEEHAAEVSAGAFGEETRRTWLGGRLLRQTDQH